MLPRFSPTRSLPLAFFPTDISCSHFSSSFVVVVVDAFVFSLADSSTINKTVAEMLVVSQRSTIIRLYTAKRKTNTNARFLPFRSSSSLILLS